MRVLLAAALLAAGCGSLSSSPEAGSIEGAAYKNPFFGLSLDIPAGWQAEQHPEEIEGFLLHYLRVLTARDDESLDGRIFHLLKAGGLPAKLMGGRDALVSIGAAFVGDKAGLDVLRAGELAKKMLGDSLKAQPAPPQAAFGGVNFAAIRFKIELKDAVVHETAYVTIRRGWALVIVVAGKTPESLKSADALLASIRFSSPS